MHHFFVDKDQIRDGKITITGPDVNHIKNVLRLKTGDKIRISNKEDMDYLCSLCSVTDKEAVFFVLAEDEDGRELPSRIWLFQGLPKADKMEMIVQKAVELGVYCIVPVSMKRCVVKLDEKKSADKVKRWNAIAESAAKQSKRVIIPEIKQVAAFPDVMKMTADFSMKLLPYEDAHGMEELKKAVSRLRKIHSGADIAVLIGPEGGFEEAEVKTAADSGFSTVSLGRRILRTETAGLAVVSLLMMEMEMNAENGAES